ncbi:RDD family protein [Actibacterium sp. XHP0104]|uniref:RDD family protein n=1 Tax=Actibacterium sp. XHP0104 TaxID=2984335 RepID=UPI0021E7A684|nr:RDD family protein [Actibacterium sp. XHP0104]MCV2880898.1 RDD family protein [Actibacterium sp. XHP0104]
MSHMTDPYWGLPDPDLHAEFYDDVPTKRLIAFVVDTIVIVLLSLLVVPFTAFTGLFFFPLLMLMVGFVYRVATLTGRSATWGMRLAAIEFRDARGRRFDLSQAFWHTALFTFFFGTILLHLASVMLMLTGPRRQGLPDLLLGSAAVNRAAGQ